MRAFAPYRWLGGPQRDMILVTTERCAAYDVALVVNCGAHHNGRLWVRNIHSTLEAADCSSHECGSTVDDAGATCAKASITL